MSAEVPLQHRGWLPSSDCFGCGPDNPHGLRIETTLDEHGVGQATWVARPHHQGPPGAVNGAVVAVPMDCHGSWTALAALRDRATDAGRDPDRIAVVTGSYSVRLAAPTPIGVPLDLRAEVEWVEGRKAQVAVSTVASGAVTATFAGRFIEVAIDG